MLKAGLFVFVSIFFAPFNLEAQICDCNEYVYLNETTTGGSVHKYLVNPNGSFSEVGSPWFDNDASGEDLTAPHGLATDVLGNLYINETGKNNSFIRRFDCDGNLESVADFSIPTTGVTNLASVDNFIFLNERGNGVEAIEQYDLCTGTLVGSVDYCENYFNVSDWGFYRDPNTGLFYSTSSGNVSTSIVNYIWVYDINDFDNDPNTCVTHAIKYQRRFS